MVFPFSLFTDHANDLNVAFQNGTFSIYLASFDPPPPLSLVPYASILSIVICSLGQMSVDLLHRSTTILSPGADIGNILASQERH